MTSNFNAAKESDATTKQLKIMCECPINKQKLCSTFKCAWFDDESMCCSVFIIAKYLKNDTK